MIGADKMDYPHGRRSALARLMKHCDRWIRPLRSQLAFVRTLENKLFETTRIAVIGSPRSGTSWIRVVLARALGLAEIPVYNWSELSIQVSHRCALQIHWYREPNFQKFLRENDFKVIVVARHPLDVLVSVLHFIRFEPETTRWLEGNVEIPRRLAGSAPTSEAFKEYALGWGAENLLSVSYQWWHDRDAVRLRYEDLLGDPTGYFGDILKTFSFPPEKLAEVLQQANLKYFQNMPNHHGWRGQAGLWEKLIPSDLAIEIYQRHSRVFSTLGYAPPSSRTTPAEALSNWDDFRIT